jgi:hypothetical protein
LNKYETLALGNTEQFLEKYALLVEAGSPQRLAPPNPASETLQQEYDRLGFTTSLNGAGQRQRSGVSLTAPLLSAVITKAHGRDDKTHLPFSRAQLTVNFQSYQAGVGVPAYIIPYEGARARGVQLPAVGTDGFATVLCFTATQNGCTVDVSGTQAEPFASHTNVSDVNIGNAATKFAAKCQKMDTRLEKLQQRFGAAQTTAGQQVTVGANRRVFSMFPAVDGGGAPLDSINYSAVGDRMVQDKNGSYFHITRRYFAGHTEDLYATLQGNQFYANPHEPATNARGIVVGSRGASGWTFHYQVWAHLYFDVYSILDKDHTTLRRVPNPRGVQDFEGSVVLEHGELWPNKTRHTW